MKTNFNKHLKEGQLLRAIAGQEDLSKDVYDHLKDCRYCKGQIENLQETLEVFGNKAQANVPASMRKVHLPVENSGLLGTSFNLIRPAYGSLAIVACALLIFFWPRPEYSQNDQFSGSEDFVEDELIMQEIGNLIENPLPEDLKDMTSDMIIGFDDDFLEFVVPDFIDDVHSYNHDRGGEMKC